MKKFYIIFFIILITKVQVFSQCYNCNSNYPTSTQSISPGQTITVSTCVYGGEYSRYNVTSGITYTWETCGDTDFDTQLTLYQGSTCGSGTVLAYNDDACGLQSSITWTANFTGTVTLLLSKYNCQNQSTCMTLKWSASGGGGGSGGATCATADPFCTGTTYNFPAGVNSGTGESGPDYCCLGSTPNPVWYYLLIDQPGNIEIYIHSSPQRDLDFICWGPFTNIDDPCMYPTTYLTNNGGCSSHHAPGPGGGYPTGNTVDCSYSASWEEWCYIPNAQTGQFYILLITNYSNKACNIIFEQTNVGQPGAGSTNCNIVICNMSSITATPSACNPSTNLYSVSGTITFTDPPTSGQLIITDNSGASQTFNPPFNSPINYTLTGLNSNGTTHTVTAQFTDAPSCTASITYNAPSACNMCNANAGPDKTICGLSTNLEAIIYPDNASYNWSPTTGISFANINSPTTAITATAPGVYTLTWNVTSTYGITCTDQVSITFDNPTVSASASPSTICSGASSVLTASGASTYNWSHSLGTGSSKTVSPTSTTTYTVTGTSAEGCTNTATVTVTVNPLPTAYDVTGGGSYCSGGTGVPVGLLGSESGVNYQLQLNGSDVGTSVSGTGSAISFGNQTVAGTYTVVATNATTSCVNNMTGSVTVTIDPLPTIAATASPSSICLGNSSVLTASSNITGTTYSWSGTLGVGSTKTVTPTSTTSYTVTGTSTAGCAGTATVSVTVNALPDISIDASESTICNGQTSVLTASGADFYSWSHNLGTGLSKTVSPTSTTTYTVTGSYANGCSSTATIQITVNPIPVIIINASNNSICFGDSSILTVIGDATQYSWSHNLGTSESVIIKPISITTYSVIGTNEYGCTNSANITITVLPNADATIKPVTPLCDNLSTITLNATDSGGVWSGNGIINQVLGTFSPSLAGAGTHIITYMIMGQCGDTATTEVIVYESPTAIAYATDETCIDANDGIAWVITTGGTAPYTYLWSNNYILDTITNLAPGEYYVTVRDFHNCFDTDTVIIKEGTEDCYITHVYVPNIFSPNDKGNPENEYLRVYGKGIKTIDFTIFDRWGNEVFHSTDINIGWDGTYKGKPALVGDYTYILKVKYFNKPDEILRGHVYLVR